MTTLLIIIYDFIENIRIYNLWWIENEEKSVLIIQNELIGSFLHFAVCLFWHVPYILRSMVAREKYEEKKRSRCLFERFSFIVKYFDNQLEWYEASGI